MTETIGSFQGPFRFLSNFAPSPVRMRGLTYPTVEHAYQAAKTLDPEMRERIRACATPGQAKRLGRNVALRDGWEEIKLDVMAACLRAKFAHAPLREMLLATGDAELVEGNTWGDRFWGVCRGEGANHLGRLLMAERERVKGER